MGRYDIGFLLMLLIFICVFLFSEIVIFAKYTWSLSEDEKKKENKIIKKNIIIFSLFMIVFPFIIFLLKIFLNKVIPLVVYILIFATVTFGLSLSTQIFKYYKINKGSKK